MPREFLKQSNYIEDVRTEEALQEAIMAYAYLESLPVNMRFHVYAFMSSHNILMRNLSPRIAGKIRHIPVTVGGRLCPFISQDLIHNDLKLIMMDTQKSIKNDMKMPKEKREQMCKEMHIRFEFLHPFVDGNGRMGRILLNLHRRALKLPFLIIKESEKDEYFKWFN